MLAVGGLCHDLKVDDDMRRAAEADGAHVADALGALRAWLLTEDAYERGGVPDEVLSYLQDHIDRLLGPHATRVAGDFLRRHAGAGGELTELARDRSALLDLLALIEGERRPGFALEWRADRPASPAGRTHREAYPVWVHQGLALARELQQELPDVDVRYFHAGDDRPVGQTATQEEKGSASSRRCHRRDGAEFGGQPRG